VASPTRRFRATARFGVATLAESGFQGRGRQLLRPRVFRCGKRVERFPIRPVEYYSQYLISAERCQCHGPPFTTPPANYLPVVDPHHVLPRTYEWTAALETTLRNADVLAVTYLGASGRKLMRQDIYVAPNPEFTGEFDLMRNDADSSYQALQAQLRSPPLLRRPLQWWCGFRLRSTAKRQTSLSPISMGTTGRRRQNRQYSGCFIPALTMLKG
jgi:hypothetical protein